MVLVGGDAEVSEPLVDDESEFEGTSTAGVVAGVEGPEEAGEGASTIHIL